ncbi:ABC transporter permease [Paenibacillus sp. GP183]|uniref:ABC transporter permease n=1 Tax=Paenibacillus sp. GP183 TaxID=1882751 RepID=UPI000896C950|nr:ABC transporter permease [Paenibacillus sp. GP183]SEB84484.1 peptide/nickel transport system permease protein [Paenibacillus sp. GP183]
MEAVETNRMAAPVGQKKKISFFRKSFALQIGLIIIAFVLIFAFFPGWIAHYDPIAQDLNQVLLPPSQAHWFGTDNFGRDVFSRVVWGTRINLQIGVIATIVPFAVGTLIGLLAGFYGGWIDSVLMRILDIFMAIPFLVLVIAIVAILGPGINNMYMAIWLVSWKEYARLIRGEVMVAKNAEYVQAAKVVGFKDSRIFFIHILPNVVSSAIVYGASDIVLCMLQGASLGFLGLGVQPPAPEWGTIIADGRQFISQAWWLCTFPGLALIIAGSGFSLFGDGLSDLLRTKGR